MSQTPGVLIHRDYWNDHLVEIKDNGDYRSLYFASTVLQSQMSLLSPQRLVLSYTQYMLLPLLLQPKPRNILVVGIGSGSFIRFFYHHFPECIISAVDYSQHIIDVARGYFQLPESDRVIVHCKDGYQFLKNSRKTVYDLILIDAFDSKGMAPTIYSDRFFRLCKEHLSPNGVVSCNIWSTENKLLEEIKSLLAMHFTGHLILPVPNRGNIVVISLPGEIPWEKICLKKNTLKKISKKFEINIMEIVKITRQNNLSFSKRVRSFLK